VTEVHSPRQTNSSFLSSPVLGIIVPISIPINREARFIGSWIYRCVGNISPSSMAWCFVGWETHRRRMFTPVRVAGTTSTICICAPIFGEDFSRLVAQTPHLPQRLTYARKQCVRSPIQPVVIDFPTWYAQQIAERRPLINVLRYI